METNARKPESAKSSTKETQGLRGLFESGLKDIYWTEKVLTKTLPKMAKNANSPELVETFDTMLFKGKSHLKRQSGITVVTEKLTKKWDKDLDILKRRVKNLFIHVFKKAIVDEKEEATEDVKKDKEDKE